MAGYYGGGYVPQYGQQMGYGNAWMPQQQQQAQPMPMQPVQQMQGSSILSQQGQIQRLNGRVIQSPNDVTPNEVPMDGSVSYFPIQGGNTILAKSWDSNGAIHTFEYALVQDVQPYEPKDTFREDVLARLDGIEEALKNNNQVSVAKQTASRRTTTKKED